MPRLPSRIAAALLALACLVAAPVHASSTVYKWVDEFGTVHLSTSKPAAGVKYQTLNLGSTSGGTAKSSGSSVSTAARKAAPPASPQQLAQRSEVLSNLQNRECVLALEALERLTSGTRPTSSAELKRLDQTVEFNCSKDPARRRDQERMAAKLRVANSPECVSARNQLADMMAAGSKAPRVQVQSQQAFVDEHCTAPVQ